MNKQKGYSLFELIITLTISGTLVLLAGGIINIGVKSYNHFISRSILLREAQNTMLFLQKKIPLVVPEKIINANAQQFSFITIEGEEIEIRYNRAGRYLHYQIPGVHNWRILLNNISNNSLNFTYLTESGSSWSSLEEIRYVILSFNLELSNEESIYENHFYIRN
jgi:prepilin-type N-terminal cleavage/methylation domain-containing protein